MTENYFCVRHKSRREHNQHSKLLFSRNSKKAHTDQSTQQFFVLGLKRNHSQTFKSSYCKKTFSPMGMLLVQLTSCCCSFLQLAKYFLLHVVTARHDVLYQFAVTLFLLSTILLRSLNQYFERSPYLKFIITPINIRVPKPRV